MSDRAAPNPKEFAQLLLAYEVAADKSAGAGRSAGFRVCEKLRLALGRLMGIGGFRSLLSRALVLASAEVPWLRTLQIEANGSFASFGEIETKFDARIVAEGEAVLVAHLLGLLVTFIGPLLTLRLLRDTWPDMDELKF